MRLPSVTCESPPRPLFVRLPGIIGATLALASPAACQQFARPNLRISVDPSTGRIIRLDANKAPAEVVLSELLAVARRGYPANYLGEEPITLTLRDVPFDAALRQIASLVHAWVDRFGDTYAVGNPDDRRVLHRFQAVDEDVVTAVQRLMSDAGQPYALSTDVRGNVTVDISDCNPEQILTAILGQVGAQYRIFAGTCQILPNNVPFPSPPNDDGVDGAEALRKHFTRWHVSCRIDSDVAGNVRSSLLDHPNWATVGQIADQLDADFQRVDDLYVVYRKSHAPKGPTYRLVPKFVDKSKASNKIVPFIFVDEADIQDVLRELMNWAGLRCKIDPSVQHSVTLTMIAGTLRDVLRNLLRQAEATYRIVGGVYEFIPILERGPP